MGRLAARAASRPKRRDDGAVASIAWEPMYVGQSRSGAMRCLAASKRTPLYIPFGPPIKQEDPLDLSILLSGGKETNQDSLSNGE